MSHLKSDFLSYVNSYSYSEKNMEFGHILTGFFKEIYPDIKSEILQFIYAPDCYRKITDNERAAKYVDTLNTATSSTFSANEDFIKSENLLISPVSDHNNQVKWLIVFESYPQDLFEDISMIVKEIKKLYKYVSLQSVEKITSVNLKTANLVSRISHDINSLIALIPKDFAKDKALSARINYSEILSRDIMYFLRELRVEKSKVPVEDLLSGIVSGIEFPSNVHFSKRFNDRFDSISVDVELIDRALSAIFYNAIFSVQIEGGRIEMTVDVRKNTSPFIEHDWLEIIVADTGPGIPREFLSEVKNPFFTTWKDQGHVGLGLSITDNIIQAHQGCLKIESEPDQGTKLIIHLPMR